MATYKRECEWLARHGFFDGEGLYFGPGADSIPLLAAYKKGHLTGFTFRGQDVFSMAKTLELMEKNPDEVFGEYVGIDKKNPYLEH